MPVEKFEPLETVVYEEADAWWVDVYQKDNWASFCCGDSKKEALTLAAALEGQYFESASDDWKHETLASEHHDPERAAMVEEEVGDV